MYLLHSFSSPEVMIEFKSDSIAVTEGDGVAMLTVVVISNNLTFDDVFVNFTTSSGTATGEIRGSSRSSNCCWSSSL